MAGNNSEVEEIFDLFGSKEEKGNETVIDLLKSIDSKLDKIIKKD